MAGLHHSDEDRGRSVSMTTASEMSPSLMALGSPRYVHGSEALADQWRTRSRCWPAFMITFDVVLGDGPCEGLNFETKRGGRVRIGTGLAAAVSCL